MAPRTAGLRAVPPERDRRVAPSWSAGAYPGVWGVTLWTTDRAPLLMGLGEQGIDLSSLGRLVERCWHDVTRRSPGVILDEYVILPDRLRAVLHIAGDRRSGAIGRVVARFKTALARAVQVAGLGTADRIWEEGFDGHLVQGPDELVLWRRRIRAGREGLVPR